MQRATLNFETLLEVTNALNSQRDIDSLWRVIADQIRKVIPWDRAGITLYESQTDSFRFYAVITNMAAPALAHDSVIPREGSAVGWVHDNRRLHIREDLQKEQVFLEDRYYVQEGLGRMINLPLLVREHCLGTLNIGSVQTGHLDQDDCKFLQQVATQIAYAIDHVLAYEQIQQLSDRLRRENEYLAEEVKASRNLRLVVGTSLSFRKVVDLLKAVAPTDTTVLLLGETGTGKEVLAQALHDLSLRSHKPFIRVNCAALPSGLNEAPRSKLRGIRELKHLELPEIFPWLPLPLHIPFDGLPVRPLPHRRHIVPVGPKLPTPQHPFDRRLPSKDFPSRAALENLHHPPWSHFRMGTAEQMDMILVRPHRFHLDRKPFRNLRRRLLDDRRHRRIQQRLAVLDRKHHMVMDLPRTVCPLSDRISPLVLHTPEGTRKDYPRSKLRGITS